MTTTPSSLTLLLVAVLAIHCTATLAQHGCRNRVSQCHLRWGWASQPTGVFAGGVRYLKKPSSLVWPGSTQNYEPFFEHRRSNMRISMTSIERPTKTTKLDLIAGILLIFVCDMLLLSFTF